MRQVSLYISINIVYWYGVLIFLMKYPKISIYREIIFMFYEHDGKGCICYDAIIIINLCWCHNYGIY
jgi:hypothetical protein